MRFLRKAFVLRFVLIYLPLSLFFGWKALTKYQQQHAIQPSAHEQTIEQQTRTVTLPDGRQLNVVEVTPEEAQSLFGVDPEPKSPEPEKAPTN